MPPVNPVDTYSSSEPGGSGVGDARVLVVDDDLGIRTVLARLLRAEGYNVTLASDGLEALSLMQSAGYDLVISDVNMPGITGIELCRSMKHNAATRFVPVILVTGAADAELRLVGITAGADDFLNKPYDAVELRARVRSLLRVKAYTDDLDSAESVICSLALTVEARDIYTGGHCERLASYAMRLGERLLLAEPQIAALRRGGYLHDVGKIGIPDSILFKEGALTVVECEVMKQHTVIGERLCGDLRSLRLVRPIVRSHHERLDGSGYPDGLSGAEIPLTAQIISVVDTYDAVTTNRPYRAARAPEVAFAELLADVRNGKLASGIVDAFIGFGSTSLAECAAEANRRAADDPTIRFDA